MGKAEAAVKILMVDPSENVFIPRLWIYEDSGKTPGNAAQIGDAMKVSVANSQAVVAELLQGLKIEGKRFGVSITESETNKDESFAEPSDGKSAGLALAVAQVALNLGLKIRESICFTGCLEPDGSVTFVDSFDES